MPIGISENFKQSFAFTKENLIGKILNLVILFVIAFLSSTFLVEIIPDLNIAFVFAVIAIFCSIILSGLVMRIYAGGEVTFANFGTLLIKGIGYFFVSLIYTLPAIILLIISVVVMIAPLSSDSVGVVLMGVAAGLLILTAAVVLALLASFFIVPATVNYAQSTGIGGAFRFGEIFARIKNAGWGEYIGSFLIFMVIGIILAAIMYIPYIGGILYALAYSFIIILQAKYFANLLN